ADFREGRLQGLVSCEVLTEGYDERRVSCIVMARPTLSPALYRQCVGRGLRADPGSGKTDCLVLDGLDRPATYRVVSASSLCGGFVEDCEGRDVRKIVREERRQLVVTPLRPSLALLQRWETREEPAWPELPCLRDYQPSEAWHDDRATEKQLVTLRGY